MVTEADRFVRYLDNLYQAVFEQSPRKQNQPLIKVVNIGEIVDIEDDAAAEPAVEYPVKFRWYENLTTAGSDSEGDASIYGFIAVNNTRVSYGAGVCDETAMVITIQLITRFASGAPVGTPTLFKWADDANNHITVDFTAGTWRVRRASGGVTDTFTIADSFASGVDRTLTIVLTSTTIGISVDGATFTPTSSLNIPTLAATSFDIGSDGSGNEATAGYYWMFIGTGSATDADLTAWAALGTDDPTWQDLSPDPDAFPNLDLSFLWAGVDATHDVMSNRWGETVWEAA